MEPMNLDHPNGETIDRISEFPDPILGLILSHLTTKDAVATSILSTRWRHLFPSHVPFTQLYLDDNQMHHRPGRYSHSRSPSPSFSHFVDKLFDESSHHVPRVEKIVLKCEREFGSAKILSWIRAAVSLNVRSLELVFASNLEDLECLFSIVNGCATLEELVVDSEYDLYVPEDFHLPNLKRLTLFTMSPCDYGESIHELLDGCPMLEELSFGGCDLGGIDSMYIRSDLLKKLVIGHSRHEDECRIVIDAPNLEYFMYDGDTAAAFSVKRFKSLHSGYIDLEPFRRASSESYEQMVKLVKASSSAIRLCLCGRTLAALHRSLDSVPLPRFRNLACLALGTLGRHGWEMVARLLQKTPKLELLRIEEGFGKYTGNYTAFESMLPRLPTCLKLCFKKIEFYEFQGEEDEIKLIEYFLKNGRVLQEVIVHYLPPLNANILPRLSGCRKRSPTCRISMLEKVIRITPSRYARTQWF